MHGAEHAHCALILYFLFFCLQTSLWGNNSNYNSEDTIGDDYGLFLIYTYILSLSSLIWNILRY